jgi:glutamyl-tRNA synthetase
MNGVYIRALPPDEFAQALVRYLRDEGYEWDEELVHRAAPLVQEKIKRLGEFPDFARFLFEDVEPDPALADGSRPILEAAADRLREVEPFAAEPIERALRELAAELDLSPRKAFQPIRVAVTGSTVSPGLFESLELLGRERVLERLSR